MIATRILEDTGFVISDQLSFEAAGRFDQYPIRTLLLMNDYFLPLEKILTLRTRLLLLTISLAGLLTHPLGLSAEQIKLNLIPWPKSMEMSKGTLRISAVNRVRYEQPELGIKDYE